MTNEEADVLADLWTRCSTVKEFEWRASILYDIDFSTRFAIRAYSFIRRHPATVHSIVCCAGLLTVSVLIMSMIISATALAFALSMVTILSGGVYGFMKAHDKLFTRIMDAEEAAGSETPM